MTELAAIQFKPALAVREIGHCRQGSTPLVLIHGWGSDSQVWAPLANLLSEQRHVLLVDLPGFGDSPPLAQRPTADLILALLADALPKTSHIIGWSLGGMLATAFANCYPDRVASLACIATNLCFQANDDWPYAMARDTFSDFKQHFANNPSLTLKRFRALQAKGDYQERQVAKTLSRECPATPENPWSWQAILDLLGSLDNRAAAQALTLPSLYLFGETDQLVPLSAAAAVKETTNIQVEILPEQAHAPHISNPATLADRLLAFYQQQQHRLNKKHIAQSFGRSAITYDKAAHLQRAVGNSLLSRLDTDLNTDFIIDMGCGTGHFSEQLQTHFTDTNVLGIDLAQGMVRHASHTRGEGINWICGDAEQIPLPDRIAKLFFSNLAIQWCEQLEQLTSEIRRVLAPGGTALISTLGPTTLQEMRAAWQAVDGFVHVNHFTPQQQLEHHFHRAGFSEITLTTEIKTIYYPDVITLSKELKALGAHNVNDGRPTGMTSYRRLQQFANAYERFREAGQLPATWEVIYCEVA